MFDTMHRESSSLFIEPTFPENLSLKRSKSIPIKDSSRVQKSNGIDQDEELDTDWRDYVVFHRIATGISKMQQDTTSARSRQVNDMCLASIIGTRNLSDDELMRDDLRRRRRRSEGDSTTRTEQAPSCHPRKSTGISLKDEPSSSLRSMLLRSYGRQENLYCLSSPTELLHHDRHSPDASAHTSIEEEAIFDLEL